MSKLFIFVFMVFCHIVDDYYLQGWLASAKQKDYWKNNAPDKLYKYDYIMALAMHSMSWSFMTMLPAALYFNFNVGGGFFCTFIGNACVHGVVDHLKANEKKINLITDQLIHVVQIIITFTLLVLL